MYQDHNAPPVNPLPPVVWLLFAAIACTEALFLLGEAGIIGGPGAIGWRLGAVRDYGFSNNAFDWMLERGQMPLEHMLRFLTFPFVHSAPMATLFSSVILLAMGKMVGEIMGQLAVVLVFVFSGIGGAVAFGLITNEPWLLGAYPCVYGLIGAYTFLLWQQLTQRGEAQLGAFRLIGFLMGIQLFFGIFFGTSLDWVADLFGFICGFALSVIVMPGGLARVRAMIKRD